MVDQRILNIQSDPLQVRSINEFTDSLGRELSAAEGTPGKTLMRELLAGGLRRALDLGGPEPKRRFLETLAGNIHKFPLQEQQSLSRVYPVEISSEYRNLASFVEDAGAPEDELPQSTSAPGIGDAATLDVRSAASSSLPEGPLQDLKRRLSALPQRPGGVAYELAARLMDEETAAALKATDAKRRTAFFGEVRLSLFKFPDALQKDLVDKFDELRVEVARLVESMTQEISRWLDEERSVTRLGGNVAPLLPKVKALFQAVLSSPFLTTFKHLGANEKRGKENFLLKLALCLRAAARNAVPEIGNEALLGQASQLRKQFFFVEGYGELMEDWLQNRVKQFNETFASRADAVLSTNAQPVLSRLRRTFRPGRWLTLADPQVEEDLFALFLDASFPRHVLTHEAIAKVLQQIASYGGQACDFHVYGSIARLPPAPGAFPQRARPQDAVEASLVQALERLPPFPPLRRGALPGRYHFGRLEVEFVLRSNTLFALKPPAPGDPGAPLEIPAEDFFAEKGPEEYPTVATTAVQVSQQSPNGLASTAIEDGHAPLVDPRLGAPPLRPPMASTAPGGGLGMAPLPLPPLPALPTAPPAPGTNMGLTQIARGPARYQPYPAQTQPPPQAPLGMAGPGPVKFGLDDDEI